MRAIRWYAVWLGRLATALLVVPELRAQASAVDEVVVVATREPASALQLPFTTHVVDREALIETQYRTLPQALRDIPGVMVQETAFGQGSPYVRGMTGFRNLLLIDGIRVNNSVFRDGPNQYWATIDTLSLDRIEMVKGPTSALYGSDAVGATVNALTADPFVSRSEALVRAASAEHSLTGRIAMAGALSDRLALAGGVTGRNFGDLEGGSSVGTQRGIGYDEHAFDLKSALRLDGGWRLEAFASELRQNNVPRTHTTLAAVPWHGVGIGSDRRRELDQLRRLAYLRVGNSKLDGWVDRAVVTVSYGRSEETRDRIRSSGAREAQGFDVDTVGLLAQFHSQSSVGSLTYGVDFYHDAVDSFSSRNPVQGPVADDADYRSVDVYVQDRVQVNDSVGLVAGLRRTWIDADADRVLDPVTGGTIAISDSWAATVGSLGVNWALQPERVSLFANLSQGFRAPNLSDLTRFDTARSNEFEVPAPGLDPERFLTAEMGVRLRSEQFRVELAVFHTDLDDLIQRVPTGRTIDGAFEVSKANVGDGWVQGVELSWNASLGNGLSLFARAAWLDGELGTFPTSEPVVADEPIDRLMPLNGSLGLRWSPGDRPLWLETEVVTAARQDRLSTRDQQDTTRIPPTGTPGYAVLNLRGGYRLSARLRVIAGVENLADRDYRVHGSGTNMPGRNFIVTVQAGL
ncbi:MAG: TonB-dependent receptor [Pseudomonadales bacterium]